MKKLLLLICLVTLLCSCKKNTQTDQPISNGAIAGSIGTAGTVTTIYATDDLGKQFSTTVDPRTGLFKIDDLAAGEYLLSLPSSPLYYPLWGLRIQVIDGKTTDTGVIGLALTSPSDPSISGYLLPAGFGTGVTATEQLSGKVYTAVPNTIGFFLLALPDGNYTLSCSAKPPLEAPDDVQITISGRPVNVGNINCKGGVSGGITGKLMSPNGAASVKASSLTTDEFVLGTIDYTKGIFNFPTMLPGRYKISFAVNPPYLVPADINAEVVTGKVTDLGTLAFAYDTDIRVLSYKLNGSGMTRYNQTCNFTGDALSFSLLSTSFGGAIPENMKTTKSTFNLYVANITAPGKYPLKGTDNSNISFTEVTSSNASITKISKSWSISSIAPVGELEVTAIDRTARTIKGVFSATLVADKSGTANKSVTEGSFYLSY